MKKILLFVTVLFASANLWSQVSITEANGWLESAYVKWTPVTGADSYNVYYTGGNQTNKKIDNELIRNYNSFFRADLLGLASGNYTITVKPVTNNIEGAEASSTVTVLSQDRTGFAFEGGRIPGAYNVDGTLKTNAVVLYITQNTKNTVSLNVTGAGDCVGLQTILDGFKKGKDSRPLDIRLVGNITDFDYMLEGDIAIENKNFASGSITFEGVGSDAVANGWGLRIKNSSNIEVRNLGFMLTDANEGDNVGLQQGNDHVWVHNCDMFYGEANGDADQVKGDGALDAKLSTNITFSYNHFWDNGKCNLLGLSENTTEGLYITYHHNWYDHSDSRHPRIRFYSAHVYNNYYDGNAKYGAASTNGSSVFMEGNFFRNCKYPMLTSLQGSDVYSDPKGSFSGEGGGTIKAFNNTMSGQTRYIAYNAGTNPIEFDAIETATRNETIPNTINPKVQYSIPDAEFPKDKTKDHKFTGFYNNFDTNLAFYIKDLVIEEPEVAKTNVMQYAGRVTGGDIKFAFDQADDDTSSTINTALKSLLTNYISSMVNVQGETPVIVNNQTLISSSNTDQTVIEGTAISNMAYSWGGDATDVTVTGLPASGISFVKNEKTLTISGTPTANVSFSVTTTGTSGSPETLSGKITVLEKNVVLSDEIHNFSTSGLTSSFYTFGGSLNSSTVTPGPITYNNLTLTANLKLDSNGTVSYTTIKESTLTLVFDPAFVKKVKVDGVAYSVPAGGVITIPNIAAGNHIITKNDSTYLYYIITSYNTLGLNDNIVSSSKLTLHPNPVNENLFISSANQKIKNVTIYNLLGAVVKTVSNVGESIDVSNLKSGSYLVKITTDQGTITQKIIKK